MSIYKPTIVKCTAREILDSRGNPTVEASVLLDDGSVGTASVPSGASTGIFEAHEKRDGGIRYGGKGVKTAANTVNQEISPALSGICAANQEKIDRTMIRLDGTADKSRLGANAILAVSLASARAAACAFEMPLWRYLGGIRSVRLPVPMFNILNGGAHAGNNVEIQEFMVVPLGAASFSEALQYGCEIYHMLGTLLKSSGKLSGIGDEGGYAPDLDSDEEALDLICESIERAGYGGKVCVALDAAAGEWYDPSDGLYHCPKRGNSFSAFQLCERWETLIKRYPICSLEDGLDQRDFDGWAAMTETLGHSVMLVGDDLFVTNPDRVRDGIERGAANCVLIKPNQIGTLTQTAEVINMAAASGYSFVMSHRSGETEDSTLADLAVAFNAPFIKAGAPCRGERVSKYNRLCAIETALGSGARYGSARVSPIRKAITV